MYLITGAEISALYFSELAPYKFAAYWRNPIHKQMPLQVIQLVLHHTAGKAGKLLRNLLHLMVDIFYLYGRRPLNITIYIGHAKATL